MSWLVRLRKKQPPPLQKLCQPTPPVGGTISPNHTEQGLPSGLRQEITKLYELGVDPIHTIQSMLFEKDGEITTQISRVGELWRGIDDLLDRDDVVDDLRFQLLSIRRTLADVMQAEVPAAATLMAESRELSRKISEMKFLQSFQIKDDNGILQKEAFLKMLDAIEQARSTSPGSRAQDISGETLAKLYKLRDNWDDPSLLK